MNLRHVLCDLDSTVFDTRHRWDISPIDPKTGDWLFPPESKEAHECWRTYSMECGGDIPIEATVELLDTMLTSGVQVSFVSGRHADSLQRTCAALRRAGLPANSVWLKGEGANWGSHKVETIRRFRTMGLNPTLFIEDWRPAAEEIRIRTGMPVMLFHPPYSKEDLLWPKYAM